MPKNTTLPQGFTIQQPEQSDDRFFIPPGSLDVGAAAIPGSVTYVSLAPPVQQALFPPGSIMDFAGTSAPAGFLLCDGSAVSRTTYSALFAAIGVVWGVGDGSTTFNVPDARGRSAIGAGTGTGLTTRTVGTQNIGGETQLLTTAQIPGHTHSGTTGDDTPDHAHSTNFILVTTTAGTAGIPAGGS
jgi:microcystin-dependent protein